MKRQRLVIVGKMHKGDIIHVIGSKWYALETIQREETKVIK